MVLDSLCILKLVQVRFYASSKNVVDDTDYTSRIGGIPHELEVRNNSFLFHVDKYHDKVDQYLICSSQATIFMQLLFCGSKNTSF